MIESIAELSGVCKTVGEKALLENITFAIKGKGVTGFLGANGAGKTTTMDILSGCQGFDSGSVKIAGHCLQRHPAKARSYMGYLPESPPVFDHLSVMESLVYMAQIRQLDKNEQKENIRWALNRLSLEGVSTRVVSSLSKGYKQRLGLAQALVHRPALMILDEPTDGLDPAQIKELRHLIQELGEDKAVFFSSHLLGEVQAVCHDIVIIEQGRIRSQESIHTLGAQEFAIYEVGVQNYITDFLHKLERITSVRVSRESGLGEGPLEVRFPLQNKEQILDRIVSLALEGRHHLTHLMPRKNLEDVFLSMHPVDTPKKLDVTRPN